MSSMTLQDLVSHVMDVFDLTDNEVDVRRAIRSSVLGYEMATTRHQWSTYDSQVTAYFNDKYETGTVDIDAAGVVTLTGGTFPSWADLASVYLNEEKAYRVATRDSDTQVTLEHWNGQTETASTYVLRQDRIILPDEVRQVYDVWNESEDWSLKILDAGAFRDWEKPTIYSGADPYFVTFRNVRSSAGINQTELRVGPGVSNAVELDIAYRRRPRAAKILTTVLATASSETVTLAKALPVGASTVGAIVRHSGTREPTAEQTFGLRTPQLATFEGTVTTQASTTSLTVSGIGDFTDERIVITDVLDIPSYALLPVQMYAEAQMARIGRGDIRDFRTLMFEADEQLRYAMEQDAPYVRRHGRGVARVDHLDKTIYVSES